MTLTKEEEILDFLQELEARMLKKLREEGFVHVVAGPLCEDFELPLFVSYLHQGAQPWLGRGS